jgi:hypothetical protein
MPSSFIGGAGRRFESSFGDPPERSVAGSASCAEVVSLPYRTRSAVDELRYLLAYR